jgi:hypothetical protein
MDAWRQKSINKSIGKLNNTHIHTPILKNKKKTGVSAIFLLSGLSLRVDQLASAAKDLKLNAAIQVFFFFKYI